MLYFLFRLLSDCYDIIYSLVSCLRWLFLSTYSYKKVLGRLINNKDVVILCNGPYLNEDLENISLNNKILICLNDAPSTPLFNKTKPRLTFIIDPYFFLNDNTRVKTIFDSIQKSNWDNDVVVPIQYLNLVEKKYPKINFLGIRINEIRGKGIIQKKLFENKFGIPRAQNVLVATISYSLLSRANNILIAGASHDWVRYMYVKHNKLYLKDHHYFNDSNHTKLWLDPEGRNYKVSEALLKQSQMFKSYDWLSWYCKNFTKTRINLHSKNSLIDSFK